MARTTNNNINMNMVNELCLYAVNTSKLYHSCIIPVCKNLARKKVKGMYQEDKALKAFYNVANHATYEYWLEFRNGYKWFYIASTATRREVASYLLDYYADYIEELADELSSK